MLPAHFLIKMRILEEKNDEAFLNIRMLSSILSIVETKIQLKLHI